MTMDKLKKIIDVTAELLKQILEEILPLKKKDNKKDEKK